MDRSIPGKVCQLAFAVLTTRRPGLVQDDSPDDHLNGPDALEKGERGYIWTERHRVPEPQTQLINQVLRVGDRKVLFAPRRRAHLVQALLFRRGEGAFKADKLGEQSSVTRPG